MGFNRIYQSGMIVIYDLHPWTGAYEIYKGVGPLALHNLILYACGLYRINVSAATTYVYVNLAVTVVLRLLLICINAAGTV